MKYPPIRVDYMGVQPPLEPRVWEEPDCYDLNSPGDRRQMYGREVMQLATKHGRAEIIANELYERQYPGKTDDVSAREKFVAPIVAEGDRFGKWFYFPWSNRLVQYPDSQDLIALLTSRNRPLITTDEQQKLGSAVVVHAGLSVGLKVLDETIHMGLGGKVIIADPDEVSLANLNRMNLGMEEVGMRKTDVAGIRVSELNPYIKQVHYPEGITSANIDYIMRQQPDLLYEHVDHLPTKVLLRKMARRAGAALVMATDIGDNSLIDVERYDTEPTALFLGRLDDDDMAAIEKGGLTPERTQRMIVKIIGHENISVRMAEALGQIGLTLGGIAQLGTTAASGAAKAAVAGRAIVLKRDLKSGRYRTSPQQVLTVPTL